MTTTRTPSRATTVDEDLVGRIRIATLRLARRLRREADAGITPTLLSVMAVLARRGSMTLSELAEAERVTPPSMTAAVARLESSRLVVKEPDDSDRRVQRVSLTRSGEELIKKVRSKKNAYLARRLRSLAPAELETIERAVELIERMLEDDA